MQVKPDRLFAKERWSGYTIFSRFDANQRLYSWTGKESTIESVKGFEVRGCAPRVFHSRYQDGEAISAAPAERCEANEEPTAARK